MNHAQLARAVTRYRTAATALRAIARNAGRTAATTRAKTRHETTMAGVAEELTAAGHRRLVAHLVEEHNLAVRLAEARRAGEDRVELEQRHRAVRTRILLAVDTSL